MRSNDCYEVRGFSVNSSVLCFIYMEVEETSTFSSTCRCPKRLKYLWPTEAEVCGLRSPRASLQYFAVAVVARLR